MEQTWRAGAPGARGVAPREGAADWLVNWSERAADALRDLIGREGPSAKEKDYDERRRSLGWRDCPGRNLDRTAIASVFY